MVDIATDEQRVSPQQWKWTILAGMASYIDAGSIVALGIGLTLFQSEFSLTPGFVGFLAALGPNAIGAGIGAFVGGRLGDKLGRKRIYKWDLLVYALGVLLIVFSGNTAMLLIGTFVVGVAVGADVPTSLALVGEIAPAKARGKLISLTQIAWSLGPAVVLILAYLLDPLGLLGVRIVFAHLFVVAMVTWALRQGLAESAVWKAASETTVTSVRRLGSLFRGNNLKALAYTGVFYIFWGLAAGTAGIFTPYIVESLNAGTRAASLALSLAGFAIGLPVIMFVVMRKMDTSQRARKMMMGIGIILQVVAYGMFLVLPFTMVTASLNVLLFGIGASLAGEPFYKTFSQELFPTMLRGTAQGFTFGLARLLLGAWSFFVPVLAATGIKPVAGLLALFLAIAGAVGYFLMPNTVGRPLTEIEAERTGTA